MPLTKERFEFVSQLALQRSAIVLKPGKEYLVQSRLDPLAKSGGYESLGVFIDDMRRKGGFGEMHRLVIEALTTNETLFFRDLHPFDAIEKKLIPEIMVRRAKERRIDIWSGASSTGQEAYSVAMLLREKFPELASWKVTIIGTDLSSKAVEKARRGIYSQIEVNRGLPMPLLVKYFEKVDAGWQIRPDLRKMVDFRQMNLIEQWSHLPRFDLVMMRNVLIYFDVSTRKKILDGIQNTLHPEGALLLGASETTLNVADAWQAENCGRTLVYRLKGERGATRTLAN
ncbi:protein-glutamate O-methyltransferase CheR [Pelagicoccus sp. SDUM812002]|uniref:CheR family methyltransferase n=1 Tax=Pelagicoccus sp. SDUM812002 TaxID=3041266 RepID=UPI00280DD2A4|nr:protein-glutamate O-methyltransferase CheR [Pelagicoccus sp. SDUM812002]MDQ8184787.1 protein-glutamate O-methyltransferase CheR [Pelagicoccus sp. SDUM812002]